MRVVITSYSIHYTKLYETSDGIYVFVLSLALGYYRAFFGSDVNRIQENVFKFNAVVTT